MPEEIAHRQIQTTPLWRRWITAEVATILMAGGFLGTSLSPLNRIYMVWGWLDTLAPMGQRGGGSGNASARSEHIEVVVVVFPEDVLTLNVEDGF